MTEWFRRKSKNIKTSYKKDTQEGSWLKCPQCDEVLYKNLLEKNFKILALKQMKLIFKCIKLQMNQCLELKILS